MAEERKIQSGEREAEATQGRHRLERYPAVDQTDAVQRADCSEQVAGEARSFDPSADTPTPRQGGGDAASRALAEGWLGPRGDPAEGKREA